MRDVDHTAVMVQTYIAMTCAALALTACSAAPRLTQKFELAYGTTRYVPMSAGDLATDYIPNDTTVIPQAIRKCGGHFLGFNGGITDGGEAAYFEVSQNVPSVADCIARRFPQAVLRPSTRRSEPTANGSTTDHSASDLMTSANVQ